MRPVARRQGRIQLNLLFAALLLHTAVAVVGVPLRIANAGIDSFVLAPIGRETIIIDTASNFHVERTDAPMELIESRLIHDNSSVPLLIDIQKVENDEQAPVSEGERLEDAFSVLPPIDEESSKESSSGEAPAETLDAPSEQPTLAPKPEVEPTEQCLDNERWLDEERVNKLKQRRRRLLRRIRNLNRQQETYCLPDKDKDKATYRKCPKWREEKMVKYYKLMRLIYCSDYSKWPKELPQNFAEGD